MSEKGPSSERNWRLEMKLGAGLVGAMVGFVFITGLGTEGDFSSEDARREVVGEGFSDVDLIATDRHYLPWMFVQDHKGCARELVAYRFQAAQPIDFKIVSVSVCKNLFEDPRIVRHLPASSE